MKFCHWNGIGFEHEICHWNGMETDQENLSTKISVLPIKMCV